MIIKPHNIRYRLAIWKTPTGEYLKGQLPPQVREKGHFGATLRSYLLYQHYHCRVTQPLLLEQSHELGIDISFLELFRGERTEYVLSSEALSYMSTNRLPQHQLQNLSLWVNRVFENKQEWLAALQALGIEKDSHVKTATEGALLGAVLASGVSPDLGIISDGAGQFRLLCHGLCWVHAERLINKLIP